MRSVSEVLELTEKEEDCEAISYLIENDPGYTRFDSYEGFEEYLNENSMPQLVE